MLFTLATDNHPGWGPVVLVLAGSYAEFRYARDHRYIPEHAIHITSEYRLMGYERGLAQLVKYGTWDERPYKDIEPILSLCRSRHMREVPPMTEAEAWWRGHSREEVDSIAQAVRNLGNPQPKD
jgi:hypothetical protein